MDGKIAVEEHFAIPEITPPGAARWPTPYWAEMHAKLIDLFDRRLAEMDRTGIEIAVLSLNADGIQAIPDTAKAVAMARQARLQAFFWAALTAFVVQSLGRWCGRQCR